MRIIHICLRGPYTDDWAYQDNILPRIHIKQGHQVTVIAPCLKHEDGGKIIATQPGEYTLSDGVRVIRISVSNRFKNKSLKKLLVPYDLLPLLERLKPDLIMLHGLTLFSANNDIIRYLKSVDFKCTLVGDTHIYDAICDPNPKGIKAKIISGYTKYTIRKMLPYYKKIFAITPACEEYAINYYKVPKQKLELLPLGYDPYLLPLDDAGSIRKEFRKNHGIYEDDIVIIHGGKIIKRRKTPETINAVLKLNNPKVKLVIFGGIDAEMKSQVEPLIKDNPDKIVYLGSLTPLEYNKAYIASDIALFPGGQSVLWQEAIGCGIPIVVGNDKHLDYLDRGGNAEFIDDTSEEGIRKKLEFVLDDDKYIKMKKVAETSGKEFFSYERMATMVTDCVCEENEHFKKIKK